MTQELRRQPRGRLDQFVVDARLVSMGLYVAREVGVAVDPTRIDELSRHNDREVRELAAPASVG
jgi:hypothetical protein